jgi:hypothetical protein
VSGIEITNAKIARTSLDIERCLTAWLTLEFKSGSQAFGGYVLGGEWGCQFIRSILETVGVESWEALPGKYIRVERDYLKIYRIGHIIKESWFDPSKDLDQFLPEKETKK